MNEIKPPNESGETQCIVRWMVETPSGWVGSWDKAALEQFTQRKLATKPVAYVNMQESSDLRRVITVDDFGGDMSNFMQFGKLNPTFVPLYAEETDVKKQRIATYEHFMD